MGSRQSEIESKLATAGRNRHLGRWFGAVAVAVALAAGGWWWMSGDSAGAGISYRTAAVTRGDITMIVTATGTVQPLNVVDISSELSGTLEAVEADFNDTVKAGQKLAALDTTQLEAELEVKRASHAAAAAQVASAVATRDEASANYAKTVDLFNRGVATQSTLDAARAELSRAEAAYAVAAANRDLAMANYRAQQAELAKATIYSPIDGVVLDVDAEKGQIVAASLSAPILFTIAEDLTKMELQVDVAEADIGAISAGDSATFTVEAYPDRTFPAAITQVRYASEETDGLVTYKAILTVDNPEILLRPGMTAVADIIVANEQDVLLVPNTALRFVPTTSTPANDTASDETGDGSSGGLLGMLIPSRPDENGTTTTRADGKSVWVLRDGKASQVAVEPGRSDGTETAILTGNLNEGDQVILSQIREN